MADIAIHIRHFLPPPKAPTHGPTPATQKHQEELKTVTLQLRRLVCFQRSSPGLFWISVLLLTMKDSFWLKPTQIHSVFNASCR